MAITAQEKDYLQNSKTSHPTGLHYLRRNPHPKKEDHGDCAVRAIALATETEYWLVKHYADDAVVQRHDGDEPVWGYKKYQTSYGGMTRQEMSSTINDMAKSNRKLYDWIYVPYNTVFHKDNLPDVCIADQDRHVVCVKHGAIWDSWDSRGKTRKLKKVIGVWCHQDEWRKFFNKHNGDLKKAGVCK